MLISPGITKAVEFAIYAHRNQLRKGGQPYIIHPLSVGFILQSAGYDEAVVVAGILHDIIEDTEHTEEDIKREFGEQVARLVMGVTLDNSVLSRQERVQKYFDGVQRSGNDVKAVCAADLLDNRRALLNALEQEADIWHKFHDTPEKYLEDSFKKLEMIKETLDNEITKEAEIVLNILKEKIG